MRAPSNSHSSDVSLVRSFATGIHFDARDGQDKAPLHCPLTALPTGSKFVAVTLRSRAQELEEARLLRDWSVNQLARELGFDPTYVARVIRGERNWSEVLELRACELGLLELRKPPREAEAS